jgi:hypothetical protein
MGRDIYAFNLIPRPVLGDGGLAANLERRFSRSQWIDRIQRAAPEADFSDPALGVIDGGAWSIEVSLARTETVDCIGFHLRGEAGAAEVVAAVLEDTGLFAYDAEAGAVFGAGPGPTSTGR